MALNKKDQEWFTKRQIMTARNHDGLFFLSIIKVDPGQYYTDPEYTYSLCAFGGEGPTFRTIDEERVKGGREHAIAAFMKMLAKYEDLQTFHEAMDKSYYLTDKYRYSKEALQELKEQFDREVEEGSLTREEADQFYSREKESRRRMYWEHFSK